jgi:hypothetical protein
MLEGVRWRIGATGEEVRRAINHLFLIIGRRVLERTCRRAEAALTLAREIRRLRL